MKNSGQEMLETAQTIITKAASKLNLSEGVTQRIIEPEILHEFALPIKKDDGTLAVYKGFRSQHNSALGPYKGGIRFHPGVNKEEVQALSTLMSIKCAVAGLPYGGGKGGVIVNPKELSERELEALSRAYASKISSFIGPDIDIPAPDVNTNPQIMGWMMDEYEKKVGHKSPATFTGKPVNKGGSLGRTEATGRGGVIAMQNLLKKLEQKKGERLTIAVQGFGNVGYYFAKIAAEYGHAIVAVSDSKGAIMSQSFQHSLDVQLVNDCKRKQGSLSNCYCSGGVCDMKSGKVLSNEELLELDVDILVPSALENVIHEGNMKNIKARIIVEMANGPVSDKAYEYLTKKGTIIIPDVLANSGGVMVSYFEWVQGRQGYWWTEEEVNSKLEHMMTQAFEKVWNHSQSKNIPLKDAAFEVAVERIASAL
jgi:glutamate dehydrogenase (NADP+)